MLQNSFSFKIYATGSFWDLLIINSLYLDKFFWQISCSKLIKTSSETPYLISFPVLKKIVREELNEYSYDLTSIFDNVKDEIFTGDYIHVNHIGNKVIARSIFDVIQDRINKAH